MRWLLSGIVGLLLTALLAPAQAKTLELKDPTGDDNGPGNYVYPTDAAYPKGCFDLTQGIGLMYCSE